jgi:hypothetical protein
MLAGCGGGEERSSATPDPAEFVAAMREQTKAAVAGACERMIEATEGVDAAFDELGETASDAGAFLCALSLERNPKTLR